MSYQSFSKPGRNTDSSNRRGRESVNSIQESIFGSSNIGGLVETNSALLKNQSKTHSNMHNSTNYMSSTDTLNRQQRETLHSRFDFIKVLGKGTYGKVKLANDKRTGKQVIKFYFDNNFKFVSFGFEIYF